MKKQEFINAINNSNIHALFEIDEIESIDKIPEQLASGMNLDEHRWYSIATNYYKLEDGIVGVTGVYQIFSQMMDASDCDEDVYAFEGEEYTTVSYRPKGI